MNEFKTYAVIGSPIINSQSPYIWHKFLKNKDIQYLRINPVDLDSFIKLIPLINLKGFNVTSPYKTSIINYIDELDPVSKTIDAVNTVKVENGKLYGYNTDVYGFCKTIENFKFNNALILGAGGASRAVLYALRERKIKIYLYNRTFKNLTKINDFEFIENYHKFLKNFKIDLLINTTPNFNPLKFRNSKIIDANYFYKNTKNYTNGKNWLIEQARKSHEIFFDKKIEPVKFKKTSSKTIFFTGFMASGKSKMIEALKNDYKTIDIDKTIEAKTNISKIFEKYGESKFRKIETKLLNKIDFNKKQIIAGGGGAIIYNSKLLKKAYKVFIFSFLGDIKSRIKKDKNHRPLVNSNLDELFKTRLIKYLKHAELLIINKDFKSTVNELKKELKIYENL